MRQRSFTVVDYGPSWDWMWEYKIPRKFKFSELERSQIIWVLVRDRRDITLLEISDSLCEQGDSIPKGDPLMVKCMTTQQQSIQ